MIQSLRKHHYGFLQVVVDPQPMEEQMQSYLMKIGRDQLPEAFLQFRPL